jgi:hypothetical protein
MSFRFRVKNTVYVDEAYLQRGACCDTTEPTGKLVPVTIFGRVKEEYAVNDYESYLVVTEDGNVVSVAEKVASKGAEKKDEEEPEVETKEVPLPVV